MVLHSNDGVAVPLPKMQALVAQCTMTKVLSVAKLEEIGAPVGLGNLSPEGSLVVINGHKCSTSSFRGLQHVFVRPVRDSGPFPEPLLSNVTGEETYVAYASTCEIVHDSGPCCLVKCNIFVVDRESTTGTTYAAVFIDNFS